MLGTEQHARRSAAAMLRFERRVQRSALLVAALPLLACGLLLLVPMAWPTGYRVVLWLLLVFACVWLARWQRRRVTYPVYTLVSLLEALREGDYSLRGKTGGALGDVVYNVNELAERLQRERLGFEEASFLLSKTLAALNSAVFVFDGAHRLRLINPAGERLLGRSRDQLFGQSAASLQMQAWLDGDALRVISHHFHARSGRFELRHARLRSGGRDSQLLVINDLGQILREEERAAWQRLLRVLGHEVNNSLAPISSMAGTLAQLAAREPLPDDWREDFRSGLQVIGSRATSLTRFLGSYGKLARLPLPQWQRVSLNLLLQQLAALQQRVPIRLIEHELPPLDADPDQLSQALLNLIHNAVEASPANGLVTVRAELHDDSVHIFVDDDGPGPPASDNLFVPFFTTKPGGNGIGLALARQIAEAHGGGVSLLAREQGGARASLWLPLTRH